MTNFVEKKEKDKKDHIVQKNIVKNAEKTTSKNKEIVPVVNVFKLLPQAKYKLVNKNKNPPPSTPLKQKDGEHAQAKKSNLLSEKKQEPKKFKVKTGQQVQKDNPILNLFSKLEKKKGQDPLKELDLGKKILQARDSANIRWDKKNNPESNDKCEQFQNNTKLDLEMPNSEPTQEPAKKTNMEKASNIPSNSSMVTMTSSIKTNMEKASNITSKSSMVTTTSNMKTSMEEASNITSNPSMVSTTSSMKKKTTIFPRKRVVPMPKKKCQPPNTEVTTSDEELLLVTKMIEAEEVAKKNKKLQEDEEVQGGDRAAMVGENTKVGNDSSDEDILNAVIELEHLKLREAVREPLAGGAQQVEHHQGDHHGAHHQEKGVKGDWQVLDPILSPRMLKSIPGRNQRWKEEDQGQ